MNEILIDYFKDNVGVTDSKQLGREVAVSLYYLTQQGVNVDSLNAKQRVNIVGARLYVYGKNDQPITNGVKLRPQTAPSAAPAPAPVSGSNPNVDGGIQDFLDETQQQSVPSVEPTQTPAVPASEEGRPVESPTLEVGKPNGASTGYNVGKGIQGFMEEQEK